MGVRIALLQRRMKRMKLKNFLFGPYITKYVLLIVASVYLEVGMIYSMLNYVSLKNPFAWTTVVIVSVAMIVFTVRNIGCVFDLLDSRARERRRAR